MPNLTASGPPLWLAACLPPGLALVRLCRSNDVFENPVLDSAEVWYDDDVGDEECAPCLSFASPCDCVVIWFWQLGGTLSSISTSSMRHRVPCLRTWLSTTSARLCMCTGCHHRVMQVTFCQSLVETAVALMRGTALTRLYYNASSRHRPQQSVCLGFHKNLRAALH